MMKCFCLLLALSICLAAAASEPRLYKGSARKWPAKGWTRESIAEKCNVFPIGCGAGAHTLTGVKQAVPAQVNTYGGLAAYNNTNFTVVTLADAIKKMAEQYVRSTDSNESKIVVHNLPLERVCPDLLTDVRIPWFVPLDLSAASDDDETCGVFSKNPALHIMDADTLERAHVAEGYTVQWYALLRGRQTWKLMAPENAKRLNPHRTNTPEKFYDTAKGWRRADVTAELEAGDVLHIPQGYVMQITHDTDTIAVSGTYLDWPNLDDVATYVKENRPKTRKEMFWRSLKEMKDKLSAPEPSESTGDLTVADYMERQEVLRDRMKEMKERNKKIMKEHAEKEARDKPNPNPHKLPRIEDDIEDTQAGDGTNEDEEVLEAEGEVGAKMHEDIIINKDDEKKVEGSSEEEL
eukprot:PhM_4_TR5513/c0_g1_i2/m.101455